MKNLAYVIGNGTSRRVLNLKLLNGDIWGCNALFRDFKPDYLIVSTLEMYSEALKSDYNGYIQFPNRIFNSGLHALKRALETPYEKVYMIGFDLKNFENRADCNFYAGSQGYEQYNEFTNYQTSKELLKEFEAVFIEHHNRIIRVIDYETCWIPIEFTSIKHISYGEFINELH